MAFGSVPALESMLAIVAAYAVYNFTTNKVISPLKSVPGPWHASFTTLEYLIALIRGTHIQTTVEHHRKYGPIVRFGPDTVSVADAEAVHTICNTHKVRKGVMYLSLNFAGTENVFSTRHPQLFKKRRRLVAPIFTITSLADMEPYILKTGSESLFRQLDIRAESGEVIDLLMLFSHMTFDVIGEIAFGKSFGLLEGKGVPVPEWLDKTTRLCMYRTRFGRLSNILFPYEYECEKKLINFTLEAIRRRRSSGQTRKDSLQTLLNAEDPDTGNGLTDMELASETITQLIGGTDTTALTLTWAVHRLLENPDCLKRLQSELDAALPDVNTPITPAAVRDLPYLNAVLNETLRLYPPGGAHLERQAPPEGITVCGHYIPGNTTIIPHQHAVHRMEKYWPNPEEFLPERWLVSQEEMNKLKYFFMPFSIGVRPCLGRHLAWLELRTVLAGVVRRFDLESVPGADMTPKHQFIIRPADNVLNVIIRRRGL